MITATAHPNIALAKYWGKRNEELNLPAVGSISITLDSLSSITSVQFINSDKRDIFYLNGKLAEESEQIKITNFLNNFRKLSGFKSFVEVKTENNFPTSAGLASSASGFAALTKAADSLFSLNLSDRELSQIARLGSGSASRSIFGGFTEWHKGITDDGSDCYAEQIAAEGHFPLSVIIAVTSNKSKKISSRTGMKNSAQTSPFYETFVKSSENDIIKLRKAILERDFSTLAEISMSSTIKMHSVMMTTEPPLFYWNSKTFEIIELIRNLHFQKVPVFFSIDAGPQVKIITPKGEENYVLKKLETVNQIEKIFVCSLGKGAEIIEGKF